MSRVLVQPSPEGRLSACPFCHSPVLQRWGKVPKSLKDPQLAQVEVHRYRCWGCRRTFRHYPQGVRQRTVALAALLWALGLSLRAVAALFPHLGPSLSRMSVLRDVRAGGGFLLLVLAVDERDARAVASALRPLVAALGVEVLVSDDLGA